MAASSENLLNLVDQLQHLESTVTNLIFEMALKLSSLTGSNIFVMVETNLGRKYAGKPNLCAEYASTGLKHLHNDIKVDFDPHSGLVKEYPLMRDIDLDDSDLETAFSPQDLNTTRPAAVAIRKRRYSAPDTLSTSAKKRRRQASRALNADDIMASPVDEAYNSDEIQGPGQNLDWEPVFFDVVKDDDDEEAQNGDVSAGDFRIMFDLPNFSSLVDSKNIVTASSKPVGENEEVPVPTADSSEENKLAYFRATMAPSLNEGAHPSLTFPLLQLGWQREVVVRSNALCKERKTMADIYYFSPCLKRFRTWGEIEKFLSETDDSNLTKENFLFALRLIGSPCNETLRIAGTKGPQGDDR